MMIMEKQQLISNKLTSRGFTLLELLLYVSLATLLLLATALFLSLLLESRVKNQTIAEVEQQGVRVMQTITQTLRNASVLNTPTRGISTSSLSLDTITSANNPTVFSVVGSTIFLTKGSANAVPLTNSRVGISGLIFSNLSRLGTPSVMHVQFTLSAINTTGINEYDYSRTFYGDASLRQHQ